MSVQRRLLGDPNVFELAAKTYRFFRQAENPEAFRRELARGNFEKAFEMVDKPEEELQAEISDIRSDAETIAEEHPDAVNKSHEELLDS